MTAKPNSILIFALCLCCLLSLFSAGRFGFDNDGSDTVLKAGLDSAQIRQEGHRVYNAHCMRCHGVSGRGTSFGPPLLHHLYSASNLPDQAFASAVLYGVKAQNWSYGDMQPQTGLSQTQIAMIAGYIRAEQKEAGLR